MNDYSAQALTLRSLRDKGEPQLFETSTDVWKKRLVSWFEEETGRVLYPDQTEMFLIETLAYTVGLMNEERQMAVLQNLAIWAIGSNLDAVASNASIARLPASAAVVTIRFSLPQPIAENAVVPAGTRLVAGAIVFLTTDEVVFAPGATSRTVTARAEIVGPSGNGFLPGQISASLGSIASGLTGANIDVSSGGAVEESDEHLSLITVDAPEQFDRRGGWGGYGLAIRRVNPSVTDVAIDRPEPGSIDLYPLLEDDVVPGDALLAEMLAALPPDTKRPQGDYLTLKTATAFDVDLIVALRIDPDAIVSDVEAGVEAEIRAAFKAFRRPSSAGNQRTQFSPETGRLGAQLGSGPLVAAAAKVPGVIDVTIDGLAFTDLPFNQFPRLASIAFNTVEVPDE